MVLNQWSLLKHKQRFAVSSEIHFLNIKLPESGDDRNQVREVKRGLSFQTLQQSHCLRSS